MKLKLNQEVRGLLPIDCKEQTQLNSHVIKRRSESQLAVVRVMEYEPNHGV